MKSGHVWEDMERCSLCGDKDWMADKYCSKNPDVAEQYKEWIKQETNIVYEDAVMSVEAKQ